MRLGTPNRARTLLRGPAGIAIEPAHHETKGVLRALAIAVATACGIGRLPLAPGTWGALAAAAGFVLLSPWAWVTWAGATVALLGIGVWAAAEAERAFGSEDDGRIVIDEVVGQLLALAPLVGAPVEWAGAVTAFVAFRVFDVWKPLPVRWAERSFEGGTGVMLDDVVAGAMAAAVVLGVRAAGWLA